MWPSSPPGQSVLFGARTICDKCEGEWMMGVKYQIIEGVIQLFPPSASLARSSHFFTLSELAILETIIQKYLAKERLNWKLLLWFLNFLNTWICPCKSYCIFPAIMKSKTLLHVWFRIVYFLEMKSTAQCPIISSFVFVSWVVFTSNVVLNTVVVGSVEIISSCSTL